MLNVSKNSTHGCHVATQPATMKKICRSGKIFWITSNKYSVRMLWLKFQFLNYINSNLSTLLLTTSSIHKKNALLVILQPWWIFHSYFFYYYNLKCNTARMNSLITMKEFTQYGEREYKKSDSVQKSRKII